MAGSRTLKLSVLADVDNLRKNLNIGQKDVDSFGSKVARFGRRAAVAFAAAAAAAGAFAIKIGKDAIIAASDLEETQSKVNVIFGDSATEIEAFASKAAVAFGQTKTEALNASANFAIFGKAAGLAGSDLVTFSTDFTALASDLASFNNTTPEDAINALGAALRGEAEPLRRYGVLLDDATLKAKALELGIYDGSGALTAQQKILAAQQVIFEQTSLAQGDYARTSDGLANSQRSLNAQFENIKATIGTALLPIITSLATFISEKVLPVITKFSDSFGKKDGLGDRISGIVSLLKKTFIPIWEGAVSLFNRVKKAVIDNKDNFDEFATLIQDYIAPVFGKVLGGALKGLGFILEGVIKIIAIVAGNITKIVKGVVAGINLLIRGYNAIPGLPNIPLIPVREAEIDLGVAKVQAKDLEIPKTERVARPTPGVVNNITVNGAIDSEGTARTIASVLTQSGARGTGSGGGALGGVLNP